jgi:peptidyl-prolyl cis-trans isomerase SurA
MNRLGKISLVLQSFLFSLAAFAQPNPKQIDGVVAVIGDAMILQSEIEDQYQEYLTSGKAADKNTRCDLFETLLFNKLLLSQAEEDSLYPSESQIQDEIDRRLRYFIQQFGSVERLEEFYEKSVDEIKIEFHDPIEEQIMIQNMQQKVSGEVEVSPKEVRDFYQNIPQDSLMEINAQFEIAQIVRKPPINEKQKAKVRTKLESIRQRVLAGEDFGTLAYLYSEDPGSARENGELGFMSRGELVPEFAAVAFSLDIGEVSGLVETDFGYHIIQPIERKGQQVNVRHILMTPKIQATDLTTAKEFLDTLKQNITQFDSLNFENAAILYSEDKDSRNNGGVMINPITGGAMFEMDQISQVDPSLYLIMDKLEVDKIRGPEMTQLRDGTRAYRLVKLLNVTEAHTANLKQDYQLIQGMALNKKQSESINLWIEGKVDNFFIKVDPSYKTCTFKYNWIVPEEPPK